MIQAKDLLVRNKRWSEKIASEKSGYFPRLAAQGSPDFLWIGCSDARVAASQIVDMMPGEIFVHRNVANLVIHSDLSCLSAMQFAVEALSVRHIIVCGHYGCSGIAAALRDERHGLVDNWLRHVRDIVNRHRTKIESIELEEDQLRLLAELNIVSQVRNVSDSTVVQDAWKRGQKLTIHGWIYDVSDALLHDMGVTITAGSNSALVEKRAINRILRGELLTANL